MKYANLMIGVTSEGAGVAVAHPGGNATFHAIGSTTSGTGAATINIEVSNSGVEEEWLPYATISLMLSTTKANAGIVMDEAWAHVRGNIPVGGISGTGASVSLYMGV